MRTLVYILLAGILMYSCSSSKSASKMSNKKSSVSGNVVSDSKSGKQTGKVRASYRSNKFHPSAKVYEKVDNSMMNDNTAKNQARVKKANYAASKKYKKKQQEELNKLNSQSNYKYKGGKKKPNDGKFDF